MASQRSNSLSVAVVDVDKFIVGIDSSSWNGRFGDPWLDGLEWAVTQVNSSLVVPDDINARTQGLTYQARTRRLFGGSCTKDELRSIDSHVLDYVKRNLVAFKVLDGTAKFLQALKGQGVCAVLVTNQPQEVALLIENKIRTELGTDLIAGSVGASDGEQKPDVIMLERALDVAETKYGRRPSKEDIVCFGDSIVDWELSQQTAGAVLVPSAGQNEVLTLCPCLLATSLTQIGQPIEAMRWPAFIDHVRHAGTQRHATMLTVAPTLPAGRAPGSPGIT